MLQKTFQNFKVFFYGMFIIFWMHLCGGFFMAYELSLFYLNFWVGVLFFLGFLVFLFPMVFYVVSSFKKISLQKISFYFFSAAVLFFSLHFGSLAPQAHLPLAQSSLYMTRFILYRAERELSPEREKIIRTQISKLDARSSFSETQ